MEPELRAFWAFYALGSLVTGLVVTKVAPSLKKKKIKDYNGENTTFCICFSIVWIFVVTFCSLYCIFDFLEKHVNLKKLLGYEIFPSKKEPDDIPFGRASDHTHRSSSPDNFGAEIVSGLSTEQSGMPMEDGVIGEPYIFSPVMGKEEICCIGISDGEIIEEK